MSSLVDYGENTSELPVFLRRQKVGSEVYLFVFYANFLADAISVKFNRPGREVCYLGDFFGGFSLLYKIGHLKFGGRKIQSIYRHSTCER